MQAIITMGAAHRTPREEQEQVDREFAQSEGFRAGRNGYAIGFNPYHADDPLYEEWRSNWMRGAAEAARACYQQRAREPRFVQKWEQQAEHSDPVALTDLVAANSDDEDLCEWAKRADVDACYMTGGGAAPACWLRRVA